jgi:hypothetical protein
MNARQRAARRARALGRRYGQEDLTTPLPPRPPGAWRRKYAATREERASLVESIAAELAERPSGRTSLRGALSDLEELYLRLRDEIDARYAREAATGEIDDQIGVLMGNASELLLRRARLRAEWGAEP